MAISKQTFVDLSTSLRGTDSAFNELQPIKTLGPPATVTSTGTPEAIVPTVNVQNVAAWTVIDKFDADLKKALIDFIDTTKEGVKGATSVFGRKKVMRFNFIGSATKSIQPGEIGEFNIIFSYPPGMNTAAGAPTIKASTT